MQLKPQSETREVWLANRKQSGLEINPATAEVTWIYALTLDPYGIYSELPEEFRQVGREYFARAPGSEVWVWFGDLPKATSDALREKHKSQLAFPAGLNNFDIGRATQRCLKCQFDPAGEGVP